MRLIVFDGDCVLCSGFAQFVIDHDKNQLFSFTTAQSDLGAGLYAATGEKDDDYLTNLVFVEGRLWTRLDAFCVVMKALGWPWRVLSVLAWLPRPLKDWAYSRIARNRFAIFGRRDTCYLPTPQDKARFL